MERSRAAIAAKYVSDGRGGLRKASPGEVGGTMAERMEYYCREFVRPDIQKKGFGVQHVGGGGDGFQYTIGLSRQAPGGREILIKGFHADLGAGILSFLGDQLVAGRTRAAEGRVIRIGLFDADFTFVEPTAEEHQATPAGIASAYYKQPIVPLHVMTAGWPCARCQPGDFDQACTCGFQCTFPGCGLNEGQ